MLSLFENKYRLCDRGIIFVAYFIKMHEQKNKTETANTIDTMLWEDFPLSHIVIERTETK